VINQNMLVSKSFTLLSSVHVLLSSAGDPGFNPRYRTASDQRR